MESSVRRLRPNREGGHTHLQMKHFKQWWREVYPGYLLKTPVEGVLGVSGRHCTTHVAHGGDPTGVEINCPGSISKRYHRHIGHRPSRDPVEGDRGTDRNPSTIKLPDAQRITQVQGWKSGGGGYNGVEARSRARQHSPIPHLPGITGPKEGLLHCGFRTPPHNTGWIQSGPLPVWTLGCLLGQPASGAKTECLPLTSFTLHKG